MIPEPACTRVTITTMAIAGSRGRSVGLRVENNDPADFPASLRAEVEVEREVGGHWQRVSVAGMLLRPRCAETPPRCVTLAPHASMVVAPWSGMLGDGQCECTRCAPAPAGRYRFVVTTCANCFQPARAVGAPFTLPPP